VVIVGYRPLPLHGLKQKSTLKHDEIFKKNYLKKSIDVFILRLSWNLQCGMLLYHVISLSLFCWVISQTNIVKDHIAIFGYTAKHGYMSKHTQRFCKLFGNSCKYNQAIISTEKTRQYDNIVFKLIYQNY
jgi:hypothetical protein